MHLILGQIYQNSWNTDLAQGVSWPKTSRGLCGVGRGCPPHRRKLSEFSGKTAGLYREELYLCPETRTDRGLSQPQGGGRRCKICFGVKNLAHNGLFPRQLVADLLFVLRNCYGKVTNLLRTCYWETGVMDFGLYDVSIVIWCWWQW